jgi:hypothetical protein
VKYADQSATTNMLKHLQKKHAEKLTILTPQAEELSSEDDGKSDDEYLVLDSNHKRKKNEQFLDYFLIRFIIGCCLPFRIVENPSFKEFVHKLNNSYEIPKRHRLSEEILNNFFESSIVDIKNALIDTFAIALTLDLWTSVQRYPYLGVTCHLINCYFEFKSYTIAIQHLPGQHTTEIIKDALLDILKKWDILSKAFALVTDNASNVINLAQALNATQCDSSQNKTTFVQFSCAAHVLNLIMQKISEFTKSKILEAEFYQDEPGSTDGLDSDKIILSESETNLIKIYKDVVHKCRKIAAAFHQSNILSNQLTLAQTRLNIKKHEIIQDVETRWNSTYLMVERILEQVDAINEAIQSREVNRKYDNLKINSNEKELMEEIINVLACFYQATVELSASKYVTLSLVIPLFGSLKNELKANASDKPLTLALKKWLFFWTKFYVEKYKIEENSYLIAATYLDVRTKQFGRYSDANRKKFTSIAQATIQKLYSEFPEELKGKLSPASNVSQQNTNTNNQVQREIMKRRSQLQCFDFNKETQSKKSVKNLSQVQQEIQKYNLEPSKDIKPLDYWKLNKNTYPILYHVVKMIFSIPATSVPSEQLFSHAGYNIWDRRNRLNPEKINKIMVCYENTRT